MLQSVLREMEAERAFPAAAPSALKQKEPEFEPVKAMPTVPRVDMQQFEAALAERDAQIAELQQAIVEISNQTDAAVSSAVAPEIELMREQVARIEARCFEQERSIRQTLTMLIEWIESEMDSSKAA